MTVFWAGDRRVDTHQRTIEGVAGAAELSDIEAQLLDYLHRHRDRMVPKAELLTEVWGYHASVRSRTVDTTLGRLRKKIEPVPNEPRFLRTHRGRGLQLRGTTTVETSNPLRIRVSYPVGADLVGRDEAIGQLVQAVGEVPHTAVLGPEGSGRGALCLEVLQRWDDGSRSAMFVELAGCRDVAEVRGRIAGELLAPGSAEEQLIAVLEGLVRPLLVLANSDAVELGPLLQSLKSRARVLTTTTVVCEADRVLRLAPLDPTASERLLRDLCSRTGFEPAPAVVEAALEVADGSPLAITLIAPVVELVGIEIRSWAGELEGLDRAGRRVSLSVLFDWVFDRLDLIERDVLLACSSFCDRFDARAALAVSDHPAPRVFAALSRLRDLSVLSGEAGWMRMVGHLRISARQRLGPGLLVSLQRRLVAAVHGWREELLGSPRRATRLRHDLLAILPLSSGPERTSLLEVVFIAALRGGWAREAAETLWGLEPDGSYALHRILLGHLECISGRSVEHPMAPEPGTSHEARVARMLYLGLWGDPVDRVAPDVVMTDPMELWALLGAISDAPHDKGQGAIYRGAMATAEERGWTALHHAALGLSASHAAEEGDLERAFGLLDVMRARGDGVDDGTLHGPRVRLGVLFQARRLDEARSEALTIRERALARGLSTTAASMAVGLALLAWVRGDDERVRQWLEIPGGPDDAGVQQTLRRIVDGAPIQPDTTGPFASLTAAFQRGEDPRPQVSNDWELLFVEGLQNRS